MDFRQLENFVEVCEQKNFTKAANNLYISQQGISKSMKALEDELGVPLFLRSSSGIALTNYGNILSQHARRLVDSYSQLLSDINDEKAHRKADLRIGFTQGTSNFLPASLLETYIQRNPDTHITLKEYIDTEVDEELLRGNIDIGFCISPIDTSRLVVHYSHNLNCYFMLSENHSLANQQSIDLRQLKNENFISFGEGKKGHESFLERCRKAGFVPNIGISVLDMGLIMNMCRNNMGIGFYVGNKPAELPGLKIIPDKLHSWEYSIHICTAAGHGISAQEADFIRHFYSW